MDPETVCATDYSRLLAYTGTEVEEQHKYVATICKPAVQTKHAQHTAKHLGRIKFSGLHRSRSIYSVHSAALFCSRR